jgi:hypothetical protein
VFPINLLCPDAPLPYSQASSGLGFPAFYRYYAGAKTPSTLPSGFVSFAFGTRRLPASGGFGSPMFPDVPLVHLPCSQTSAEPPRQASLVLDGGFPFSTLSVVERVHISFLTCVHRFDAVPAIPTTRTPAMPISRLYHTAFALAVYASCRGFPTTSKTRFRLVANLYRMGLVTHRDILKGFTTLAPCCSPLPGLIMARRNPGLRRQVQYSVFIAFPLAR